MKLSALMVVIRDCFFVRGSVNTSHSQIRHTLNSQMDKYHESQEARPPSLEAAFC
jgi:hypothetical protein